MSTCFDCAEYPKVFPASCIGTIASALRGREVDVPLLLRCGYSLTGWALGQFHPAAPGTMPLGSAPPVSLTYEQAALQLEGCAAPDGAECMAAMNWRQIAIIIMELLSGYLAREVAGGA